MEARTNQNMIKGSKLMLFVPGATAGSYVPIGFATSHSLSMTTNTTQVSTKDHGDYPATIAQNISWEVSAENIYSTEGRRTYVNLQKSMSPVHIEFVAAANYLNNQAQKGLPMDPTNPQEWTIDGNGDKIAEGDAILTSFSINAPSGDNATMSATFTGTGELQTTWTS